MSSNSPQQDAGIAGPPPPLPSFIYRGHDAPVHSLEFFAGNRLLVSGDEQGWLFIWDLWKRRPMLKWRAHGNEGNHDNRPLAILSVKVVALHNNQPSAITASQHPAQQGLATTQCLILSHGRDHHIHVWDIRDKLAELMLTKRKRRTKQQQRRSILDSSIQFSPKPVFTLPVNALNFCKMDVVGVMSSIASESLMTGTTITRTTNASAPTNDETSIWPRGTGYEQILVAVPSPMDANKVDVYDLLKPEQVFQGVEAVSSENPGQAPMDKGHGAVMAIRLLPQRTDRSGQERGATRMLVGYEDGSVGLFQEEASSANTSRRTMSPVWMFKGHREPVLGIAVSSDKRFAISCASDNILIRYTLASDVLGAPETLQRPLKANGIAEVQIRDDDKIVALAGWDGKIRVFSFKTLKPLAVLACHRESLYCIAFASVTDNESDSSSSGAKGSESPAQPKRASGAGTDDSDDGSDSDSDSGSEDDEDRRRLQQYTRQHWIVAGGKENRISQWQIY